MANKAKKTQTAQKSNALTKAAKKVPMPKRKKITLITVSALIAAVLIAALIVGIVATVNQNREVDYINDDLSKYIYISSENYKNYPVSVKLLSVDESDVRREINKLLVTNKDKNALFGGAAVRPDNYTIKLGDVANIWYRGYTVDESGVEKELAGANNLTSSSAHALEIGSGSFIKGIEEGLIGKPLQSKSPEIAKSGKVKVGDVIYISYSAFLANGTPTTVTGVRIDTSDKAAVDKIYGNGFARYFLNKTIGDGVGSTQAFRIEGDNVDTVYYDLKIDYAVRTEVEPYVVDVVFPADYHEVSYRGLEAKFEIYVSTAVIYNTPEWSDSFLIETLKVSEEVLSGYEGETLTQKYENKLLSGLKVKAEETNKSLIEEQMWKHYLSKVNVKKLPQSEVNDIYRQYLSEVNQYYNAYGVGFNSFDEFARHYFDLSDNADWKKYMTSRAEEVVTERLIFYYIIDKEDIVPPGEEYERIYNETKKEYMDYYTELYKKELEACKTEEEKAAKLLEIEKEMLEYYGESYFTELVYYQYALDYLIGFADLK